MTDETMTGHRIVIEFDGDNAPMVRLLHGDDCYPYINKVTKACDECGWAVESGEPQCSHCWLSSWEDDGIGDYVHGSVTVPVDVTWVNDEYPKLDIVSG